MATRTRTARFEEGVSADPTENMSPEDAAEWDAMNEEHGDKFKAAAARLATAWGPTMGDSDIDPRAAVLYFDIVFADYDVEEDASGSNGAERQAEALTLQADPHKMVDLELKAATQVGHLLGKRVHDEGHGSDDALVCKVGIDDYGDVVVAYNKIMRAHGGGDDEIYLDAPYCSARGFRFYPRGVNGPSFGADHGEGIDDWLLAHKPGRRASVEPQDARYVRNVAAQVLLSQGMSSRGRDVLTRTMAEAVSFMFPGEYEAGAVALAEEAAERLILKLRNLSTKNAPPAPLYAGPAPTYLSRDVAWNYSHYQTDEMTDNYDAVLSVTMTGGLMLTVKNLREHSYAGGGPARTTVVYDGLVGTVTKPNLGVIRAVLAKYSHDRTSLGGPFSAKWYPVTSDGKKNIFGERMPLAEILATVQPTGGV